MLLAILAAATFGAGAALQHRAAARAPKHPPLHLKLLVHLVMQPLWLIGIVSNIIGYGLEAAALAEGNLVIVEPLLMTGLIFALGFGAILLRQPLAKRDWFSAFLTICGVTAFLEATRPSGGHAPAPFSDWISLFAAIGGFMAVLAIYRKHMSGTPRAVVFAATAGACFGTTDALTKASVEVLATDQIGVLTSWFPYALIAVALGGLLFQQNAYHTAHMVASLPATSILQPSIGVVLGITLFGESIRNKGIESWVAALAVAAMVSGVILLARSPLLSTANPARGRLP